MRDGSNPFGIEEPSSGPAPGGAGGPTPLGDGPSMRRRRPSRLVVLVVIAAAAGAVLLVSAASGSGSSSPGPSAGLTGSPLGATIGPGPSTPPALPAFTPLPVAGPGSRYFTTAVPGGWALLTSSPTSGVYDFELSSPPGMSANDVIPPAGVVEVQILQIPRAASAAFLGPHTADMSPRALLRFAFAPKGATQVVRSVPRSRRWAGHPAAERTYRYRYHRRPDVQTMVLTRDAHEAVSIEVDSAPGLRRRAQAELASLASHWQWLTAATAVRTVVPVSHVHVPPTGPLPQGQWIASGFNDSITGTFANAKLDQRELRAWDFERVCVAGAHCHLELVTQLMYGGTAQARVVLPLGSSWWKATFPALPGFCARVPNQPTPKQTTYDTVTFAWAPSGHTLLANEISTTYGCGDSRPASIGTYWKLTPVPGPSGLPALNADPDHAASAAAFAAAAARACSQATPGVTQLAERMQSSLQALRTSPSNAARVSAELRVGRQLTPLLAQAAHVFALIPQPPPGPLDALWLSDVGANRRQVQLGASAAAALEAAALSTGRYLRERRPLQLQAAVTQTTLLEEDLEGLASSAAAADLAAKALGLPASCTNEPALRPLFDAPTLS